MDKAIIFLSNVPHLVFIIKTRTLLIFFQVISVGVFVEKAKFLFTLKLETYAVKTLIQTSLCRIFCRANRMEKRKKMMQHFHIRAASGDI